MPDICWSEMSRGPMNVRILCLSILFDTEAASGYEIRKLSTEGEFAYFVEASFGSIYPALAKLEEERWSPVGSKCRKDDRPRRSIRLLNLVGAIFSILSSISLIRMCTDPNSCSSRDLRRTFPARSSKPG